MDSSRLPDELARVQVAEIFAIQAGAIKKRSFSGFVIRVNEISALGQAVSEHEFVSPRTSRYLSTHRVAACLELIF